MVIPERIVGRQGTLSLISQGSMQLGEVIRHHILGAFLVLSLKYILLEYKDPPNELRLRVHFINKMF